MTQHTPEVKEKYWNSKQKKKVTGAGIVVYFTEKEFDELLTTLHQKHTEELEKAREEEREACAVTVWNYLATFTDCLEPTERTNALLQAVRLIRKRTPTKTDKQIEV